MAVLHKARCNTKKHTESIMRTEKVLISKEERPIMILWQAWGQTL